MDEPDFRSVAACLSRYWWDAFGCAARVPYLRSCALARSASLRSHALSRASPKDFRFPLVFSPLPLAGEGPGERAGASTKSCPCTAVTQAIRRWRYRINAFACTTRERPNTISAYRACAAAAGVPAISPAAGCLHPVGIVQKWVIAGTAPDSHSDGARPKSDPPSRAEPGVSKAVSMSPTAPTPKAPAGISDPQSPKTSFAIMFLWISLDPP